MEWKAVLSNVSFSQRLALFFKSQESFFMSKIRAAIKAQIQERNSPFISIYELIQTLVNNDNCTFIEAANILGYIIEKNIRSIRSLYYVRHTNNNNNDLRYIKFSEYYKATQNYKLPQYSNFELLVKLLNNKIFDNYDNIFLKDYGVERSEFYKLLAEEDILIDLGAGIGSQPILTVLIVDPLPLYEPIKTTAMDGFTDRVRGKAACLPFSELSPTVLPLVALGALGGTTTVWTLERKTAARTMLNELKGQGSKAYAANTAAEFGVTPTRLRQVLNDKPKKAPAKKGVWDL